MELGNKCNMKFPHFSVNGKEMRLILHSSQYKLLFFIKVSKKTLLLKLYLEL